MLEVGLLHLLLRLLPSLKSLPNGFVNHPLSGFPFGSFPHERGHVTNGHRTQVQSVVNCLALSLRSNSAFGIFKTQVPNPRCISPSRSGRGESAARSNGLTSAVSACCRTKALRNTVFASPLFDPSLTRPKGESRSFTLLRRKIKTRLKRESAILKDDGG